MTRLIIMKGRNLSHLLHQPLKENQIGGQIEIKNELATIKENLKDDVFNLTFKEKKKIIPRNNIKIIL